MKIKYIGVLVGLLAFVACNEPEDVDLAEEVVVAEVPAATAGSADFSNYVAMGPSFTAGFTDGGLFIAAQENSFPNILAKQFANAGGGVFTQPLMNDNFGGLAVGGNRIPGVNPRLVFGGAGPVPLESLIGPVTVSTDLTANPSGPFNNLGVPGAKSFHMIAPGYGNLSNLALGLANPYAVRLTGSNPDVTLLELAVAQSPTFFTLGVIGGNDVLGYATSGGDGSNAITPSATFEFAMNTIMSSLTANGAKGVVGNTPNVSTLAYFTTVPHNPLDPTNEAFGPQIATLNATFAPLNQAFAFLEMPERSIVFSNSEASSVVIHDESLPNIQPQLNAVLQGGGLDPLTAGLLSAQFAQSRQATEADLLTLPSSNVIATLNQAYFDQLVGAGVPAATAGSLAVNGVTFPLEDTWVLLPSEQEEIENAVAEHNAIIASVASANGIALVDLNTILLEASTAGIKFDDYSMTTNLVTGGLTSLDGIHLTARGYALMANKYLEVIDAAYGSNFVESGNVAKAGDYPTNYSPSLQ